MRILYSWLKDFVELPPAGELAARFAAAGIETASVERTGAHFTGVKAARIVKIDKHPNADKLSLVEIDDGGGSLTVVCGAQNIAPGLKVPLARAGAQLPEGTLKKAKIRGVESLGMICSASELKVPGDASGIMVLADSLPVGTDVAGLYGGPDFIFELEIPPNRPDLLSYIGIARELSALLGVPVKTLPAMAAATGQGVPVNIENPQDCPRYACQPVKNVSAVASPLWLQKRLEAMGTKPRNLLVDVTNYVLYETGHPLHAFDLDKLAGPRIEVRRARDGEKFTTLDAQELKLDCGCLVIADKDRAVALAGVIGGADSGVTADTKNVLLESAYFNPELIHATSRRLALKTEAAARFGGGADIDAVPLALSRAASLITQTCGAASLSAVTDNYALKRAASPIKVTPDFINSVLGAAVNPEKIAGILNSLGKLERGGDSWSFVAPSYRHDLKNKWDLADETARFSGYGEIPASPRPATSRYMPPPKAAGLADALSDSAAGAGFQEVQNYDFISAKELAAFGFDSAPTLENPLSKDWEYLRPSLIPGLMRSLIYNEFRGRKSAWLFESGKTYSAPSNETLCFAGLMCGAVPQKIFWRPGDAREIDFYHLKGALNRVLHGYPFELRRADRLPACYHPKQALGIFAAGGICGFIGKINPQALRRLDTKHADVWAFEFNVERFAALAGPASNKQPEISQFPSAWRDISVIVDAALAYEQLLAEVLPCGPDSAELTDVYSGKGVPEGKKSLTLRLVFSRKDRTLRDAEVDEAVAAVLKALGVKFGACLRS